MADARYQIQYMDREGWSDYGDSYPDEEAAHAILEKIMPQDTFLKYRLLRVEELWQGRGGLKED